MKKSIKGHTEKELFFVIFKGSLGKETFLTNEEGVKSISDSYDRKEHLKFLSYDPKNLQKVTYVTKKYETIAHWNLS